MKKGKTSAVGWEWERSYKDERGLTCLPQMLQKINPHRPRKIDVIGKVERSEPIKCNDQEAFGRRFVFSTRIAACRPCASEIRNGCNTSDPR